VETKQAVVEQKPPKQGVRLRESQFAVLFLFT